MKLADRWFERRIVSDEITLIREPHVDELLRCNIWHVKGRDSDLLVDTGMGICSLKNEIEDLLEKPVVVVATHSHLARIFHKKDGKAPVIRYNSVS